MTTRPSTHSVSELKPALETLETNAATPIVAGDLAVWIADLRNAWSEASAQIHYFAKHSNPRQYDELVKQDPELLPRVEVLQAEDAAIEDQRSNLSQCVNRLAEYVSRVEPDENKALMHIKSFTDELTLFLARVRKQSVAIQTWYGEAFNRDRGAVD